MIQLESITPNIVKFTVPEKLHESDFSLIAPQIDNFLRVHESKIRLLIDASKFNGWQNIAAFEKHMGFVKAHQSRIEKGAIIAGHEWIHWLAGIFRIFVRPEIKIFDKDQDDQAMQWIKS